LKHSTIDKLVFSRNVVDFNTKSILAFHENNIKNKWVHNLKKWCYYKKPIGDTMKRLVKISTIFLVFVMLIVSSYLFSQKQPSYRLIKKIITESNKDKSETIYHYDKNNNLIKEVTKSFSQFISSKDEYNCLFSSIKKYEYGKEGLLKTEHEETYDYKDHKEGYYDIESYYNTEYNYDDEGKLVEEIQTHKYRSDYYDYYYNQDDYHITKTTTKYVYDKSNKLIEEISVIVINSPKGQENTNEFKTTYEYNEKGLLARETEKNGEKIYEYDEDWNLISTYELHAFGSERVSYEYNEKGYLIHKKTLSEVEMSVTESDTTFQYNDKGLLIKENVTTLNYITVNKESADTVEKEIEYIYEPINN
jgi:hypothetical protein